MGGTRKKERVAHEGEPGKDKVECLIDELNVNPELAREAVRRAVYVVELDRAVYRGEERAVEPPPALRDQLWDLNTGARHVSQDTPHNVGTQASPDPEYL